MIMAIVAVVHEISTEIKMGAPTPKNGFLVVAFKLNEPEEILLTTQEGPVIIKLGVREGFSNKAVIAINAPRSIPITRRKIEEFDGRQG